MEWRMAFQDAEETIRGILAAIVGVQKEAIREDLFLVDDLGVDSVALMEFIGALETEFDLAISQEMILQVRTVGDLFRILDQDHAYPSVVLDEMRLQ